MEIKNSNQNYEHIEKIIPDRIPQLRKILQAKHNIIVPTQCDKLLARCIRMENGHLELAMKLVKEFYIATGEFSKWDAILQPSLDVDGYNQGRFMVLSQRDYEGRLIYVCRVGMWDPDTMAFDQVITNIWMLWQYITAQSKDTQRRGFVTIWDLSGFSMKHIWASNKCKIPYVARLVQNHTVATINEFHAINYSNIFRTFFSTFVTPFLKESLQKWIFFHDNQESLHSVFDKNGLPTFLGGHQEIEKSMDWKLVKKFFGQDQYYTDTMKDRFPRY